MKKQWWWKWREEDSVAKAKGMEVLPDEGMMAIKIGLLEG